MGGRKTTGLTSDPDTAPRLSRAELERRAARVELEGIRARQADQSEQGQSCDAGVRPCVPGAVLPSRILLVASSAIGYVVPTIAAVAKLQTPGGVLVTRHADRGIERIAAEAWVRRGGTVERVADEDLPAEVERADVVCAAVRDLDPVPADIVRLAYRTPGSIVQVQVQGPAVMPVDAVSVRGQKARAARELEDTRDAALEARLAASSRRRGEAA
jgi:hypothetical protein